MGAHVANVAGFFHVSMDVLDNSGTPLTQINARTAGARHAVHVENISTTSRDARVVASLPSGRACIEFVVAGAPQPQWNQTTLKIPNGQTRDIECDLRRSAGPARKNEPIQCDEICERRGTLKWKRLSGGVPFQITIDVT